MKARPILFSAEMVRAILDGRKSQTRRVVKLDSFYVEPDTVYPFQFRDKRGAWQETSLEYLLRHHCPYGEVGDRLWVRETWKCEELEPHGEDGVRYKADGAFRMIDNTREASEQWMDANRGDGKWRPSIFMPLWASRITLQIMNVRVERLQEISEHDAEAEGISMSWTLLDGTKTFLGEYELLWNQINGAGAWQKNPWVWVIEFQKIG